MNLLTEQTTKEISNKNKNVLTKRKRRFSNLQITIFVYKSHQKGRGSHINKT